MPIISSASALIKHINMFEITDPAGTPTAGYMYLYVKDGQLCVKDDTGTVYKCAMAANAYSKQVIVPSESNVIIGDGTPNPTEADNTLIGFDVALTATTGADQNTAVGSQALNGLTTGNRNTAIGAYSLYSNEDGVLNTAVGRDALGGLVTGDYNVAVGSETLATATGTDNTAIGYGAGGALVAGDRNVFIGANAGAQLASGSDKLYIASSNTTTPLIYGEFDGGVKITSQGTTKTVLTAQGAPSQTANLQTWRNGAGTMKGEVLVDGTAVFVDVKIGEQYLSEYGAGVNDYFSFDSAGRVVMYGAARVKWEERIENYRMRVGASAPTAAFRQIGTTVTMLAPVYAFSKTTQQDLYWMVYTKPNIDISENITMSIVWLPGAAWTAGNYKWVLEYIVKTETGNISTGASTSINVDVTPSNAYTTREDNFSATIDVTDVNTLVYCHLYRDVANDNADDVGELLFVEAVYTINKLGEA